MSEMKGTAPNPEYQAPGPEPLNRGDSPLEEDGSDTPGIHPDPAADAVCTNADHRVSRTAI